MLAGAIPKDKKGESIALTSFAYTQTIIRLYANDGAPIPKLKRTPGES